MGTAVASGLNTSSSSSHFIPQVIRNKTYGSTWVGAMASRALISSIRIPRRLREQVLVDPAINCPDPIQDWVNVDPVTVVVVVMVLVDLRMSNKRRLPKNLFCARLSISIS